MTQRLVLERHVLGAAASAYDTAWDTLGWSTGIAGARADRLAESVPWGTALARIEAPPRLRGPIGEVASAANLDRLRVALLPMDGLLGFSVWGAYELRSAGEWRVLTHTILLDEAAFRTLAGNPFHLLAIGAAPGGWLRELAGGEALDARRELAPVVVESPRSVERDAEAHRIAEVRRLFHEVGSAVGTDVAAARVQAVWEALARGGAAALAPARDAATVARVAWLSLPLEDRAAVPFTTGQARSGRSAAILAVLESEWGRTLPDRTRAVGATPVSPPDEGVRLWTVSLADPGLHGSVSARARARRWSLLRGDVREAASVLAWQAEWAAHGPQPQLAARLMRAAAAGPRGRVRAAGYAMGRALRGRHGDPTARAHAALEAVAENAGAASTKAVRGVVRGLARSGDATDRVAALLARLGAVSAEPALAPAAELHRLDAQEASALASGVSHPEAVGALCAAGSAAGRSAVALAAPLVAALGCAHSGDPLAGRSWSWLLENGMPAALAAAVDRLDHAGNAAGALLRAMLPAAAAAVPVPAATQEALLRIAWREYVGTGSTTLPRIANVDPHGCIALLAQLMVAPAPLPLFLRIRATLLEVAAGGARGPLPSRAAAASPALARAMAGESSREALVLIEGA